jgi:hypothetical protein
MVNIDSDIIQNLTTKNLGLYFKIKIKDICSGTKIHWINGQYNKSSNLKQKILILSLSEKCRK